MGAFSDLQQLLISKRVKLTPDESNALQSCTTKAVMNCTVSLIVAGAAFLAAPGKLDKAFPVKLAAGAATCGLSSFAISFYSNPLDDILSLDGSTLQKEFANIVVTKYQHDASLMKLISKHFYSERIYDDSTSNTPKLRWRYRNFFSDNVINGNMTQDHDSYNKSQGNSRNDSYDKSQGYSDSLEKSQGKSENNTDSKRTTRGTKQISINPGPEILSEVDPLDCLFGYGAPMEEIFHPNTPNKPSGTHHRGHRRHRRRHRMRNPDDLSTSEHAAAV